MVFLLTVVQVGGMEGKWWRRGPLVWGLYCIDVAGCGFGYRRWCSKCENVLNYRCDTVAVFLCKGAGHKDAGMASTGAAEGGIEESMQLCFGARQGCFFNLGVLIVPPNLWYLF
jgi:hypothetical protein